MTFTDVLRKIVLPIMTLASVVGVGYVTYLLAAAGSWPGAACTALLVVGLSYFLYVDARKILAK